METKNNNQTKIEGAFSSIFNSKGTMCSVAEKAKTNLEYLLKNKNNLEYRLFYITIGNSFKNIDKESLFGKVKNETTGVVNNMRFDSISKPKGIEFYNKLEKIVNTVRNINNHFIHDFNALKINNFADNEFIIFLKEAFEVAIIMSYCNEESIDLIDFFKKNRDREIVNFLHDKFFPFSDKRKDSELTKEENEKRDLYLNQRKTFKTLTKEKAIDELLFIDLDSDLDWKLNEVHKVLTIEKGIYLSQYAQLFLVSMFLYKNEAEKLISKVKGFKRNDENRFKSKRRIFTFFSKKFSSQDIDAEENNLVKYQDMIQYVNHYPTAWNKALEPDSQYAVMTNVLETKLLEFEINKNYPHFAGNNNFLEYAKLYLFGTEKYRDTLHIKYLKGKLNPTEIEFYEELKFDYKIRYYRDEIGNPKDLENLLKYNKDMQPYTIFLINYVFKKYFSDDPRLEKFENHIYNSDKITGKYEDDDFYNKIATNTRTIKLIKRIENNLFYTSNGRNQDRFMDFACRYLAETNFFGSDVKFKMYQFYTSDEQSKYLIENKDKPTKKEFEKKKFHQGKLVHFSTYASHLENYPNWDMPFVIENNAIQIIINRKLVSIQRNLIIYLLEHALYSTKMKGGKALFQKYLNQLEKEKTEMISTIDTINNDGSEEFKKQKATYLKLFPSRLVHIYTGIEKQEYEVINFADKIINETKKAEDRYKSLYDATKDKEQFLKKNKGKIFKLRFIKKAWNIMFFKDNSLIL